MDWATTNGGSTCYFICFIYFLELTLLFPLAVLSLCWTVGVCALLGLELAHTQKHKRHQHFGKYILAFLSLACSNPGRTKVDSSCHSQHTKEEPSTRDLLRCQVPIEAAHLLLLTRGESGTCGIRPSIFGTPLNDEPSSFLSSDHEVIPSTYLKTDLYLKAMPLTKYGLYCVLNCNPFKTLLNYQHCRFWRRFC